MLQRSILCMQGTQYATKRSILCRGAFCGPTWLINFEWTGGKNCITVND